MPDLVDEHALLVDRVGAVENVDPFADLIDRVLRRGRDHDHLQPVDADQLLYDLSRFNFAQFVVRNFDISRVSEPGIEQFRITGFNSFDEAHTYAQQLFADKALSAQLRRARTVLISDRNLQLLGTSYSFDDYARFYEEKFAPLHIKPELYLDAEGQEIRQIYEDELPEDYQPEPDEEEPVDDGGEWYEE